MSGSSNLDTLSGLVALVSAVQTGSFSAAGRELGLSGSAVGKAISRLEGRMSAKLFYRTTRSLTLTQEGQVVWSHATAILAHLKEAETELAEFAGSARGRLQVSLPTVLGRRYVIPRLAEFTAAYPEVELDVRLDDTKVKVVENGYDVVLRLGELEDSSLKARRLGVHSFVTCASPAYLAERGRPRAPEDLRDHRCVHFRFPTTGLPEVWAFTEQAEIAGKPFLVLDDGEALLHAALSGLGIVQAPSYLVSSDIAAGRLEPVLSAYATPRGGVWLVFPPLDRMPIRTRVFCDFVCAAVGDVVCAS